jgi:DNA-binding GntR family transcriptional regulator
MARLRPQTTTSLVELIAKEIKVSILSGTLRPGEPFSIAELSNELDVSHIPVREALRRLEADGLVRLRPSRSAIVTPLSVEELAEIYQLRLLVEVDLAARSAPSYTSEQLELIESLCEEIRKPHGGAADPRDRETHHRFHENLLLPAAGEQARRILWRLWEAADRYIGLVYDARPMGPEEPYRRHRLLVLAAQKKRGPVMRKALAEHLGESLEYMMASLEVLLVAGDDAVSSGRARGVVDSGANGEPAAAAKAVVR